MLIYETSMIVETQKATEEIILLLEDEFELDGGGLKGRDETHSVFVVSLLFLQHATCVSL